MMMASSYILIGIVTGICSGFLGLGGGFILIPAMVYFYGMTQHQAQGTSLAVMIPPITFLAALRYYHNGNVKVGMAAFIACGFVIGCLIGAHYVHSIPDAVLKKIFGAVLLATSLKMILF